ncbi:protein unc-119 homolog A [Neoarius graeffei]|uniref:protein unc-119 homolog A n=1 Tax=Neoarius graeffei TaxID=443677 RepID=UPI00298C684F|nr:protein unc-119 homolog A [Neoarius graeffei]XP_060758328.1 protein unc-119 homolog A [Neoarius graeffei]XP_060758329.1 protein unc-119 homolog A [Neoarius graeffei]XP_060758331.1 protein unc-119 homolog A [Neoarius graeffei]
MDSEEEKEREMSPERQEESQETEDEAGDVMGQKEDKEDEEDEERGDMMGQMKDMEEWNGILLDGVTERTREDSMVVVDWKPGDPVTPQYVLTLARYTQDYLCSPEDNIYNIRFSRFKIRDLEHGSVILDLKRHCPTEIKDVVETEAGRFIQYHFTPSFLNLREIGATLEFTVGSKAVNNFRLIERHYFRELLLKTFDFEIGFCIPYSRNTCEHIYSLPDLDTHTIEEMIAHPFETQSDSFYFANNKLIMHHKAEYSFSETRNE